MAGATMGRRAVLGAAAVLATTARAEAEESAEKGGKEVLPNEDLMREHGVLRRVLLIYGEAARRLEASLPLAPEMVLGGAEIVRKFVEDYHEKQEEEFVFPRMEKANREVALVRVLREQHEAGRKVTGRIVERAKALKDDAARRALAEDLRSFIRMYEPHAAREDTVLFPAFREVVSAREYRELGEKFEEKEHAMFGAHGFEEMVGRVTLLEKDLGIFDLAQFTPR